MEEQLIKQRLALWLRGERAFGLDSVVMEGVPEDFAVGVETQSTPALAAISNSIAPATPRPVLREILFKQVEAVVPATSWHGAAPITSPVMSRQEKIAALCAMDQGEVKPCTQCVLCKTRKNTVFGEGDPDAQIFFIGEGPGENEDLQGRPFVGRAGELLNKMFVGMGLQREQVFIANIVKCRPPGNRVPAPEEVISCTPYLVRQLEIVRPKVIVTLGLPSSKYMLDSKLPMGKMRGQWHSWRGIKLMPTFHPAFLLRAYTEENRAMVWSDLKQVMGEVGLAVPSRQRP